MATSQVALEARPRILVWPTGRPLSPPFDVSVEDGTGLGKPLIEIDGPTGPSVVAAGLGEAEAVATVAAGVVPGVGSASGPASGQQRAAGQ